MASPIIVLIKLLFNPNVSNKMLLQMALNRVKAIGIGKIISALLGSLLVGVSSFIRVPQILKLTTKTTEDRISVAEGLSLEGLTLDTINSLIHVIFNYQHKIPFLNYGESLLLGIQNAIIILLTKYYRLHSIHKIGEHCGIKPEDQLDLAASDALKTVGVMIGAIVVFAKLVPSNILSYLEMASIPISIIAKLPQIRQNYRLKTAKHLSDIVLKANVVGALIRVYTSSVALNSNAKRNKNTRSDKILVAGYSVSLLMHSILLGQSIVYDKLKKKDKDVKGIEEKKEE